MSVSDTSSSSRGGTLARCLLFVAQHHGCNISEETLLGGLPLDHGILTPSSFTRAAKRLGFTSQIHQRPLVQLNKALFPAILLLQQNQSCVLLGVDYEASTASIVYPDLPDHIVNVSLEELEREYAGRVFYVRPEHHFDSRTQGIVTVKKGHWFWSVISENKNLYKEILLAAFLINLFALASPLFVMNVYDRVVPNHATDTLWVLALGVVLMITADLGLRILRAWFVDLAASRADIKLSATIMERVLGMKMAERPVSVGSFASSLQGFESIRSFISSATVLAFVDLPFVLVFVVVVTLLSWPLLFPIALGIAASVIYGAAVQHKMHSLSENVMQAGAQRNAVLVESLQGLETLKILGAEGRMQAMWEKTTLVLSKISVKMRMLSGTVGSGTAWIQQFISVVIIVAGVYLIINGHLSQGGLVAVYMLSGRIMAPISQSAALMAQYHQAATALASLENIMSKPVDRPLDKEWVSRPRFDGAIEFKQVGFIYPQDEREILRSVSLRINPGEHVAILGRNGSGKTTLQKLIAGLYEPSQGTLLVDGIDIRQLDPAELRRNIGYVTQDVNLFFGSLRDNITMSMPNATDEQVLEAVKLAGLSEFVNLHPAGLGMQVGEHGQLLSGGQRQSVTLARTLIKQPSILLLDEPTGALDHSSEEEFKKNIREFAAGKTLLVITHRTSLLELVNRIIVIDAGKIVADGPKEQVVEALRQGRIGRAN